MANIRECINFKNVHVCVEFVALCHLVKGGNKDNILEWIGLSFNFRPWVPIKRMLQEEGFFLLQLVQMFLHPNNEGNKWN